MKKLLLLALVMLGGVVTANATDYIISGNRAIVNGGHDSDFWWQDGGNLLTETTSSGIYTLVVEGCSLTANTEYGFKVKVNENAWNDATTFPGSEYRIRVPYTGTYTIIYYVDIANKAIRVIATPMLRWGLGNSGNGNWDWLYDSNAFFTKKGDFEWTFEVGSSVFTTDFSFRLYSAIFQKQAYPNSQDLVLNYGVNASTSAYFNADATSYSWKLKKPSSFDKVTITAIYNPFASDDGTWDVSADVSGTCGDGVTWTLSDGTMTISKTGEGTGAMNDYASPENCPWYNYRDNITSVVIENGVTTIGSNAFHHYGNLATVNIGSNVTTIGNFAFFGSTLTTVDIPNNVTSIGNAAFGGCYMLTKATIGSGVTTIGEEAFNYCTQMTTVTLNSNPYFGRSAFSNNLATITMNLTANAVGDDNWMTFCSDSHDSYNFVADANTQVFKVTLDGDKLTMHEVEDKIVNAGTGVVLKKTGGNPVMTRTTSSSTNSDNNSLTGVLSTDGVTNTDGTFYVLNYKEGTGVGFYKLETNKKIDFGKAYLAGPASGGARQFFLFDEATGISSLTPDPSPNGEGSECYDLQGRRVAQPTKGLYIVNGKKVIK